MPGTSENLFATNENREFELTTPSYGRIQGVLRRFNATFNLCIFEQVRKIPDGEFIGKVTLHLFKIGDPQVIAHLSDTESSVSEAPDPMEGKLAEMKARQTQIFIGEDDDPSAENLIIPDCQAGNDKEPEGLTYFDVLQNILSLKSSVKVYQVNEVGEVLKCVDHLTCCDSIGLTFLPDTADRTTAIEFLVASSEAGTFISPSTQRFMRLFRPVLESPKVMKVLYNSPYVVDAVNQQFGIYLKTVWDPMLVDSWLAKKRSRKSQLPKNFRSWNALLTSYFPVINSEFDLSVFRNFYEREIFLQQLTTTATAYLQYKVFLLREMRLIQTNLLFHELQQFMSNGINVFHNLPDSIYIQLRNNLAPADLLYDFSSEVRENDHHIDEKFAASLLNGN